MVFRSCSDGYVRSRDPRLCRSDELMVCSHRLYPDIRRSAFEKLAALAVQAPAGEGGPGIVELAQQYQDKKSVNGLLNGDAKPPSSMVCIHDASAASSYLSQGIRQLDVLLSVCKATSSVHKLQDASRMVSLLSPHLPRSYSQRFHASSFLQNVKPSPWETLTYNLVHALLSLGSSYPPLRETVSSAISHYLKSYTATVKSGTEFQKRKDTADILCSAVSLVGFMEASALHTSFWSSAEKLQLVECLADVLSEPFMTDIERASSTIRNFGTAGDAMRDWRKYSRRYVAHGRPLGAMLLQQGFLRFIKGCTASTLSSRRAPEDGLVDNHLNGEAKGSNGEIEFSLVKRITEIVSDQISLLDDGADYLQLWSPWQQRLTFSVKALCLTSFLDGAILNSEVARSDILLAWLEDTVVDVDQMACAEVATAALKSLTSLAKIYPSSASSSSHSLLRFLVRETSASDSVVAVAAQSLAQVLGILSQDAVITTLYSLGNVLSRHSNADGTQMDTGDNIGLAANGPTPYTQPRNASAISIAVNGVGDNTAQRNAVHAIVTVATSCKDDKIAALAQSILLQKIGRGSAQVDAYIIQETASLALCNGQAEFQLLLKFYVRAYRDAVVAGLEVVSDAVQNAMMYLSVKLKRNSPRYRMYLVHLLESIVNKGNATDREGDREKEVTLAYENISPFLKPLALLVSFEAEEAAGTHYDDEILSMFRDTWFNLAVHGITLNSDAAQAHIQELRLLAEYSPPLVAEDRTDLLESDVELNTILRRGMSPHRLTEQRSKLTRQLPRCESDVRRLNYPRVVFLNAVLVIEGLRASTGDCTKILNYFLDPALATNEMASCMGRIADTIVGRYLIKTISGKDELFSTRYLSKQLADFFVASCHRIKLVQVVARACANKIITECPSALCERHSLFSLLELLSVMWSSSLEGELDEFEWRSSIVGPVGLVKLELPDDYGFRRETLDLFHERAKTWVKAVMNSAPLDIKGLLQTYLSEFEDDGAYGHISMGRSFALEMGSLIPQTDQWLGKFRYSGGRISFLTAPTASIDGGNAINIASGFVAQYTARQKYPRSQTPPMIRINGNSIPPILKRSSPLISARFRHRCVSRGC